MTNIEKLTKMGIAEEVRAAFYTPATDGQTVEIINKLSSGEILERWAEFYDHDDYSEIIRQSLAFADLEANEKLVNDRLFIQEIINDLERNGYNHGGKAFQLLRDWSAELRDKSGMAGKTKKVFREVCGLHNW